MWTEKINSFCYQNFLKVFLCLVLVQNVACILLCKATLKKSVIQMASGSHGENFRFLPTIRGSRDEHFPRIIHIAGVYPEITPNQLLAPLPLSPSAAPGNWVYDFIDAEEPHLGSVALPGSEAITNCIDPVVLIAKNTDLNVAYPVEVETLVVIDRGNKKFNPESFFICKTPSQQLKVMWMEKVEPGYDIMGKVALVALPYHREASKLSGFLEEDGEE